MMFRDYTHSIALLGVLCLTGCAPEEVATRDYPHPTEMELPAPSFERPDPEAHQVRFPNGMVGYVVEDTSVPLVTLSAVVAAGPVHGQVAGAAEVLAAAWRAGGTTARSRAQVAAELQSIVGQLTVTQRAEETEVVLNVPREDLARAVSLFADLIRSPRVTAADIRAAASTGAAGGGGQYSGSLDDAVAAFHQHLFDGHPLGRPFGSTGRVSVLSALSFHRQFVTPGSVTLAVGGDVSREDATRALTSEFADWGPAIAVERTVISAVNSDTRRDVLLHPADKLQGWVVLGHELPPVPLEDQAPLEVMNYILGGGHFDTRLFRATRDRRGLTNDDSGFLAPGIRAPGSYTFRTYGRPEVISLLVHLTLEEISRIRSGPVNPEELTVAKGALADGEFTTGYRTGHAAALTLAREWNRYGDHERSATYQSRIRAVTATDVQSVAQRYLLPERIDIVIVGPISEILNADPIEDELPIRALGVAGGPGAGM